jgi:8-oxo-dGTP diphosphatase
MTIGRFIAGISAVIWSPENERYLLLHRADHRDYGAGVWECLTGRVEQGEGFEDALRREVYEELNTTVRIAYILGTTHFYRGKPIQENELVGVVYLCYLDEPETVSISSEHSEYRWLTASQAIELLSASDPSTQWACRVIERAEIIRSLWTKGLVAFQQDNGLELG